ncbi:MAG: ABC transporter permease [Caldisericum exile]|uniref:ABC transporter permease n=1 Tax=Caldisericum exile TaxID=693075 RepID=UPI003C735FA4
MRKFDSIAQIFLIVFVIIVVSGVSSLFLRVNPYILLKTFKSKEFLFSLKFSLLTSSISLLISLLFSIPIAYVLSKNDFLGKEIIKDIMDIPIFLPPLVLGLAYLILFGGKVGSLFEKIGIQFLFSPLGVVFAQFVVITPYVERNIEVVFSKISKRYEFIGKSMGLSDFEVFKKIIIPLAKDGIFTGLITGWSRAIAEFGATLMIAGATKMRTETFPIAIFLGIASGDMDFAVSTGVLMIIISFLILFMVRGAFERNVSY